MVKSKRKNADGQIKVAIGCQGGGMHDREPPDG